MKYILAIVLLCSCSAQWHLERARKKDPSIFTKMDTTYIHDTTVYTQAYIHEDTFSYVEHDTITYEDTVMKIKFVIRDKKIYMKAEVKPDTLEIRTTIRTQYYKVQYKNNKYLYILILVVLLCVLYKVFKNE
jgi:hypothetical protein